MPYKHEQRIDEILSHVATPKLITHFFDEDSPFEAIFWRRLESMIQRGLLRMIYWR
jgi:hypothetical protein